MTRRLLTVLVTVAVSTAGSLLAQQARSQAAAFILGRVVDAVTGEPIAGATVTIRPTRTPPGAAQAASPPLRLEAITGPTHVMTDDRGRFLFHGLPAGAFAITSNKPGYMSGAYGRRTPVSPSPGAPAPAPLVLVAGEHRTDVTISLWKHGVIGGRVVDEHGEPMIGMQVRILRRTFVAGRMRLSQAGNMPVTDDRGIYRMATLEPGEYVAGIVHTHATMPVSIFERYAAASHAGQSLEFSRGLSAGGASMVRDGVRVGAFVVGSGSPAPGGTAARRPGVAPPTDGRLLVYRPCITPASPRQPTHRSSRSAPARNAATSIFSCAMYPP
jgi:hypothetical protein